jgi:hypothetical protein
MPMNQLLIRLFVILKREINMKLRQDIHLQSRFIPVEIVVYTKREETCLARALHALDHFTLVLHQPRDKS